MRGGKAVGHRKCTEPQGQMQFPVSASLPRDTGAGQGQEHAVEQAQPAEGYAAASPTDHTLQHAARGTARGCHCAWGQETYDGSTVRQMQAACRTEGPPSGAPSTP